MPPNRRSPGAAWRWGLARRGFACACMYAAAEGLAVPEPAVLDPWMNLPEPEVKLPPP
jgi:hypothetical protein